MGLNRRTFLQKAGLGLAALGASETVLSLLGDKSLAVPLLDDYFQALAQPAGRKLALLVGINQYPHSTALGGCVTDVDLQRELLIYRFGFTPSDILTLTDSQATRQNIETAFVEHLTEQAKAGDVVLFHFSGYGSRVKLAEASLTDSPDRSDRTSNSLVPFDGILQTNGASVANDLLEETLALLLRSLASDRITTVLDTSYTAASRPLQGNLRVRSCPNPPAEAPSPEELAFQEQIRLRTSSLWEKLTNSGSRDRLPGVVLAAAGPEQLATEALWHGFSAGLFTYALTQHLWQATPATTVQISLSRAAGTVKQLVGKEQQPGLMGQKSLQQPLLAYYLPPDPSIGADGVVTAVEDSGKAVQLWLAGLPAMVLEYYGSNSLLKILPSKELESWKVGKLESLEQPSNSEQPSNPEQPSTLPQLLLRSKEGLTARARILGNGAAENYQLQVGQLVQEAVRVLPRSLGLAIALDARLERIERVDATSAFATIPSVSSVVVAGEQPADYLFGKVQEEARNKGQEANGENTSPPSRPLLDARGGYGLFYLAREPIHSTAGEAGEAVKSAVNRLAPKLKTLLAAKLLRLTANEGSSRLGIRASLEVVAPQTKVVMQRETFRASSAKPQALAGGKTAGNLTTRVEEGSVPNLPMGSQIQYRLENYSDATIYFMLLGLDTSGSPIALYEIQSFREAGEQDNKPPLQNAAIAPGETLTLPHPSAASNWVVQGPPGLAEIQLICSHSPFTKAIQALEAVRRPKGEGDRISDLFNPLDVAQAVLSDLHDASAVTLDAIGTASDTYALDVNAWATLSFIYQVV